MLKQEELKSILKVDTVLYNKLLKAGFKSEDIKEIGDAYEFFGGTVSVKNLIAFSTADDDYDFDFGYSGSIQYAVALRNPKIGDTDQNNGIECDNNGEGTSTTLRTHPKLSNFTLIGPNTATPEKGIIGFGNRWRRATNFTFKTLLSWHGLKLVSQ